MASNKDITPQQKKILKFFIKYQKQHACAPSYEEIAEAIGINSRGNAYRIVSGLVAAGLMRRTPNKSRTLQIVPRALPF